MILGSHNSWSFLPAKKWWQAPFKFMAKCQDLTIVEQYYTGVRCFDLRIRFDKKGNFILSHGFMQYLISLERLEDDLQWLNNKNENIYIRILHDARNKFQYISTSIIKFQRLCVQFQYKYPNLKFWCGRNLYNWKEDYEFYHNPSCKEIYSSVCSPKLIDDWYPRLFAKKNNKEILKNTYDEDILLIDFVNYR